MMRLLAIVWVCLFLPVIPALATQPGERLTAEDIVVVLPFLSAQTILPVDPAFDYGACEAFPFPMDLHCGLLAVNGFDAEGRQYAARYTSSTVSGVLPRTEIWRTTPSCNSELIAYLEPRDSGGGTFDDGRIERIAVDVVHGGIMILLTTTCFPPDAPTCTYGRANEIVSISGLRTLAEELAGAKVPTQDPVHGSPPPPRPGTAPRFGASDEDSNRGPLQGRRKGNL